MLKYNGPRSTNQHNQHKIKFTIWCSGDGRPTPPDGLATVLCGTDESSTRATQQYLEALFAYRSLVKTTNMATHYRNSYARAVQRGVSDPTGMWALCIVVVLWLFYFFLLVVLLVV
jgi:hypothetical protein